MPLHDLAMNDITDATILVRGVLLITGHSFTPPGLGVWKQRFRFGQRCCSPPKRIETIGSAPKESWNLPGSTHQRKETAVLTVGDSDSTFH
jgi:hypothetical protein